VITTVDSKVTPALTGEPITKGPNRRRPGCTGACMDGQDRNEDGKDKQGKPTLAPNDTLTLASSHASL